MKLRSERRNRRLMPLAQGFRSVSSQEVAARPENGARDRKAPSIREMKRARTAVLLCALLPALSACNIYNCVYRSRFVGTAPESNVAGVGTFAGFVNFRDYSDNQPVPTDIVWNIELSGTTATPTRLVLADRRDTTQVLATLPIQQTQGRISASAFTVIAKSERDRVFDIMARGNGVLILSLSDRAPPVLITLRVTNVEDWHTPICS